MKTKNEFTDLSIFSLKMYNNRNKTSKIVNLKSCSINKEIFQAKMVENKPEVNKPKQAKDNSNIVNLDKVDNSRKVHDL